MRKTLLLTTLLLAVNVQSFAQTCNDKMLASTPDNRFTVNNDGTVTDVRTGLIWKQCLEGMSGTDCSTGMATEFNWQEALQHAAAQGNNWRLPNIKELASIVELRCYDPAINLTIFPNTPSSFVWSGSPYAYGSNTAWYMYFDGGSDSSNFRGSNNHVRLVRGGQ